MGTPRGFGALHAEPPTAPSSAQRRLEFGTSSGTQQQQQQQQAAENDSLHAAGEEQQAAAVSEAQEPAGADVAPAGGREEVGGAAVPDPNAASAKDELQAELQTLRSKNAKLQQQVGPGLGQTCQPQDHAATACQRRMLTGVLHVHLVLLLGAQVAVERQLAKAAADEKADIEASMASLTSQVSGTSASLQAHMQWCPTEMMCMQLCQSSPTTVSARETSWTPNAGGCGSIIVAETWICCICLDLPQLSGSAGWICLDLRGAGPGAGCGRSGGTCRGGGSVRRAPGRRCGGGGTAHHAHAGADAGTRAPAMPEIWRRPRPML